MARPIQAARTPRTLLLAAICVVIAALYFAREVLIPFSLAVLLTFLLTPLVARMERLRIGRIPSVITVVTLALAAIVGMGYIVFLQIEELASDLPTYRTNIAAKIEKVRPARGGMFERLKETAEDLGNKVTAPSTAPTTEPSTQSSELERDASTGVPKPPRTVGLGGAQQSRDRDAHPATQPAGTEENPIWVLLGDQPSSPVQLLDATLGPFLSPLGTAGMVLIFTVFMLLAREDMRDRVIRLVGQGQLTLTTQALNDAGDRISRYLLMQSIVNGTYGITISLGLWWIGVPNPFLFGLLCAVLRFIPYIGPWIGAAFPLVVALGKFSGSNELLLTIGLFVVVELISNNAMEPWLYGASTGMSTVAVLVAAVFWTWLWGPVGLLLSTPLTVILVVLGKYVPQLAFLDILLGDEPVLEPSERLYQRLLALDQEEATELVRGYRAKQSLEEVYDTVMMPALGLAEQDSHRGTLDEKRQKFIRQAMRDIIDELGESERTEMLKRDAADVERAAKEGAADKNPGGLEVQIQRVNLPTGCVVNIICLPAHDDADEIINLMLTQLLQLRGFCSFSISTTALASEMLDEVEKKKADLVVVSALPPSAVAHARYLCKRVHGRFADAIMLVGIWTYKGDIRRAKDRIACADSVHMSASLIHALAEIQQMIQPIITKRELERASAYAVASPNQTQSNESST